MGGTHLIYFIRRPVSVQIVPDEGIHLSCDIRILAEYLVEFKGKRFLSVIVCRQEVDKTAFHPETSVFSSGSPCIHLYHAAEFLMEDLKKIAFRSEEFIALHMCKYDSIAFLPEFMLLLYLKTRHPII